MPSRLLILASLCAACAPADRPEGLPLVDAPSGTLAFEPVVDAEARVHGLWRMEAHHDEPVLFEITLDDRNGHRRSQLAGPASDLVVDVVGFREDRPYVVAVQRYDPDRTVRFGLPELFPVDAPPLPAGLPDTTLRTWDGEPRPDTLFPAQSQPDQFWLLRVDGEGHIVWALRTEARTLSLKQLDDGSLLFDDGPVLVRTSPGFEDPVVLEPTGEVFEYHHDAIPTDDGGLLAIGNRKLAVDDYPTSYETACEPGQPAVILDPVVVELDAEGTAQRTWSLAEALDTHRIGWGGLAIENGGFDWGHANALVESEDRSEVWVSLRSQDTVVALDKASGQPTWILGPPDGGWDPALESLRLQPTDPDFRWPRHSHAIEPVGQRLLLFDNSPVAGSPCGEPADHPLVSRLVMLDIDPAAGTVSEAWSWSNGLLSQVMGDADRLGGNRILGVWGQVRFDEGGSLANQGYGAASGRIVEVERGTGRVVWDLAVTSDGVERPSGWSVPRAQRLP